MRILVTRPAEDAPKFIKVLTDRGDRAVWSPSLVMRNIEGDAVELHSYQAVAITSANAVRALASRTRDRQTLLFCVGAASAVASRELGFTRVQQSGGEGVTGLLETLRKNLRPEAGPVLYPSAAEVAGNLATGLAALGIKSERLIVYRMDLAERLSSAAEDALRHGALDLVTYFSIRSVHGTRQAAETSGLRDRLDRLSAVCLSPAVGVVAKQSHKRILSAQTATEAGMLQALDLARRSGL